VPGSTAARSGDDGNDGEQQLQQRGEVARALTAHDTVATHTGVSITAVLDNMVAVKSLQTALERSKSIANRACL